ncbi:hypothetical protein [Microbacterium paulum]|jgi:hypothetical protein|nr:hypothetical protein [Microbacterium sp.]
MGIFQSRPEEPDEWAGLPAEPWEPRVPGEVLPSAPIDSLDPLDPAALGWGGALDEGATGHAFVAVPIETTAFDAAFADDAGSGADAG